MAYYFYVMVSIDFRIRISVPLTRVLVYHLEPFRSELFHLNLSPHGGQRAVIVRLHHSLLTREMCFVPSLLRCCLLQLL